MHHNVSAKIVAVTADGDIGVAAALKVFANARDNLVDNALSQGVPHVHVLARNLNIHRSRH
jgi:hypothetical protein